MDELVKLVTDKVGISPDQAQKAVTIVLGFLKDRLPAPLGEELDKVVSGGAGGSGGLGAWRGRRRARSAGCSTRNRGPGQSRAKRCDQGLLTLALLVAVLLAGCGSSSTTTTTTAQPATTTSISSTATSGPTGVAPARFEVPLSGDQSVPPVQTSASGTAILMLEASPNGFNISFELDVTDIVDVTAAHIHLGAAGTNGPVIVSLFSGPQKPGSFTGVLAKGAITEADLTGPMAGKTFADLAAMVLGGQTYVNVHTVANPDGEIRGQVAIPGAAGPATTTTAGAGTTTTAGSGY